MRELADELGGRGPGGGAAARPHRPRRPGRAARPHRRPRPRRRHPGQQRGYSTLGRISSSDPEDEMAMVEVDVVTVVDLCSRFLPGMVARDRGAVLNVASTAAFQPLPGQAGYAAGKAFVLSYTQSLVGELRGSHVTATALCPGPVKTGFGPRAGFSDQDAEDALPAVMWVEAADVARQAVAGLDAGRMVVVPGLANKVGAVVSQRLPPQPAAAVPRQGSPRTAVANPGPAGAGWEPPPSASREDPCVQVVARPCSCWPERSRSAPPPSRPTPGRPPPLRARAPRPRRPPSSRSRWAAAARCRRSTSTPPRPGSRCSRAAATRSTRPSPRRPRSASPSRSAPASAGAATSSTTTPRPEGLHARRPRDRAGHDAGGRVHRPRDRRAVPVHARPRHQRRLGGHARHPADLDDRAPALGQPRPGEGARARRSGSPSAGSSSTPRSTSR